MKDRPEVPEDEIIPVNNAKKKIDFSKPYQFVYTGFWYDLAVLPLFLIVCFFSFLSALFFTLSIRGRKNLRGLRTQGHILISNHCHYFDTVLAGYRLFPRKLFITVVQRNYEVPFVRLLLRGLRALPIPSSPAGLKMITKPLGEVLKKGHHVMFLPEGELVFLSQTIHRFRPGAFYMSYIHQAPILPMVYLIRRRRFRGRTMGPAWVKLTQVFGEPIYPPKPTGDAGFPKEELDEMMEKAASWMEERIAEYHGKLH